MTCKRRLRHEEINSDLQGKLKGRKVEGTEATNNDLQMIVDDLEELNLFQGSGRLISSRDLQGKVDHPPVEVEVLYKFTVKGIPHCCSGTNNVV